MRRQILMLLVAAVALSALVTPAASGKPRLKTSRVYFTCVQGLPPQNVTATAGMYPSWAKKKPTGSYQSGSACGQYDSFVTYSGTPAKSQKNAFDTVFVGSYKGPLNAITVEAHNVYAGAARATHESGVAVRLTVDGRELLHTEGFDLPVVGEFPTSAHEGETVDVTPVVSETGISEMYRFTITGIGALQNKNHNIVLSLDSLDEQQSIWVWNAVEIPSGLTFNPKKAERAQISAK